MPCDIRLEDILTELTEATKLKSADPNSSSLDLKREVLFIIDHMHQRRVERAVISFILLYPSLVAEPSSETPLILNQDHDDAGQLHLG
jgi:hypothetical protein